MTGIGKQMVADLAPSSQHTLVPGPFATDANLPNQPICHPGQRAMKGFITGNYAGSPTSALYTRQ